MEQNKIKVGIFFGGSSREREISFAGGRTVYDNLNRDLFEPIPIFVDSFHQFVVLKWEHIYKGSIRDFYPQTNHKQDQTLGIPLYADSFLNESRHFKTHLAKDIGEVVTIEELTKLIDFAFLALHGTGGEDGSIQGLLSFYGIPFSGSGMLSSTIGMDKSFQKRFTEDLCPTKSFSLTREEYERVDIDAIDQKIEQEIGFPCVIRPANQGSSIGVSRIDQNSSNEQIAAAINEAFFRCTVTRQQWLRYTDQQKLEWMNQFTEVRSHLGFPVECNNHLFYFPKELFDYLETSFATGECEDLVLEALNNEHEILFESFIEGKEFSCIVIRDDWQNVIALPPTEIQKGNEVYDYRSKYLPGLSRKITPIDIPRKHIDSIVTKCKMLFERFRFQVYARIDGFIQNDGTVYLNDPNTTSGMLPSSFFFHQAAEIGLNPSQFLTFIIRNSIAERVRQPGNTLHYSLMLSCLDDLLIDATKQQTDKKKIGVILGGYSSERHISVESGRNIYEKLSSSSIYDCEPYFLKKDGSGFQLYHIPIQVLLKDNADDIADKIESYSENHFLNDLRLEAQDVMTKYTSTATSDDLFAITPIGFDQLTDRIDFAFIALHGRPGEDGELQRRLIQYNIPYNGSRPSSSEITIDKFRTLQVLKNHGFSVANQRLLFADEYFGNKEVLQEIDQEFSFPLIAKPQDDGCSSAVKLIHHIDELKAYLRLLFRQEDILNKEDRDLLKIKEKEEFPMKNAVLLEQYIERNGAAHFLEITGGLLCHHSDDEVKYEMFEPSETLSTSAILSLEEKFLAGEGQNITPARFHSDPELNQQISNQVKDDLQRAARILHVEGYARIDAFVRIDDNQTVETLIIEVNSLPGMTPATCIFHQAAINQYKPFNFIHKIIEFGLERKDKELV